MLRIGLTGGIASGKTAVGDRLAELGAVVVDADVLAREVVAVGTPGHAEVVATFGRSVVAPDGAIDRPALAKIVFADVAARRKLEAIVHPRVRIAARAAEAAAVAADPDAVVVHVIPLLAETGRSSAYDRVVVVDVAPAVQLERLVRTRDADPVEAQQRIDAQASRADRLAIADDVLANDGTLADLLVHVDALWSRLQQAATGAS